ncbi:transcriptional regulator FilR1 domain-containing protein [Methanolobus sp. ZRKC2]|uniref:helix-turn-helix transcriptional regulator n=1 Tax=Methanolobus sp. ZRKC2 TaxID=3125783 RepID=UPI0032442AF0
MKKKSLQAVLATEKCTCLLSSLSDGQKNVVELSISSGLSIREILLNVRQMEDCYLISQENGLFRLTSMGELIIKKLEPLLYIEKFLNTSDGYLQKRNLDFIPLPLLTRLYEIDSFTVVQPSFFDMFDYNKEAHERSKRSKSFRMVAASLHPYFPELFRDLIDEGVNLYLIFDSSLLDKLKGDNYDELQELVSYRQVKIYMYPQKMYFLSLKVNDFCIVLKLLTNEGTYDHKQLMCHSPDAVIWGKELFNHYLKDSMQVTQI